MRNSIKHFREAVRHEFVKPRNTQKNPRFAMYIQHRLIHFSLSLSIAQSRVSNFLKPFANQISWNPKKYPNEWAWFMWRVFRIEWTNLMPDNFRGGSCRFLSLLRWLSFLLFFSGKMWRKSIFEGKARVPDLFQNCHWNSAQLRVKLTQSLSTDLSARYRLNLATSSTRGGFNINVKLTRSRFSLARQSLQNLVVRTINRR